MSSRKRGRIEISVQKSTAQGNFLGTTENVSNGSEFVPVRRRAEQPQKKNRHQLPSLRSPQSAVRRQTHRTHTPPPAARFIESVTQYRGQGRDES